MKHWSETEEGLYVLIAEKIIVLIKKSRYGSVTREKLYEQIRFNSVNIDTTIDKLIVHDVLREMMSGVCIGDKASQHIGNLPALFQSSRLPNKTSNNLTTPNTISTPKKATTLIWNRIWAVVVGISVLLAIIVAIYQLKEWGVFDVIFAEPTK